MADVDAKEIALKNIPLIIIYVIAIRHEEAYLAGKFGQTYLDYKAKNLNPTWKHPMGTDNLGRDMLAQVLALMRNKTMNTAEGIAVHTISNVLLPCE